MGDTVSKPVDIDHLNRYTGGDSALNGQILRLFDDQCAEILGRLESQLSAAPGEAASKSWREGAHALKGAARGIGAFALADSAADAEKADPNDRRAVIEVLTQLKTRAATVHEFINEIVQAKA